MEVDVARKTRHSGTSLVLILLLAFQAGCATAAVGPPEPIHPENNDQLWTLHDADRVDVVLIDGNAHQLRDVEVYNQRLQGRSDETQQVTSFPLDSIQSVQAFVDETGQYVEIFEVMAVVVGIVLMFVSSERAFR